MGFARYGEIDPNKIGYSQFRKTTAATAVTNQWYDDTMLAGIPPANYYAATPLKASALDARDGIRHWLNDGASSEHLLDAVLFGDAGTLEAPAQFLLCDYVMFYPFLDGDSTDQQDMDNSMPLPRFADGAGLRMFIVAQGTGSAGANYTISYTNQAGVSGRTATGTAVTPTASGFVLTGGGAVAGQHAPFVALQAGDYGVRSVQSFTWATPPGGIACLVVVKPLASLAYMEIGTPAETVFYPRMPLVHGDAFLGMLRCQTGATPNARVFSGFLRTIRS